MLIVRKIAGLATVQDEGRPGFASHGVPRGGALVPPLARRANAALGNDRAAACVEIFGRFVAVAERSIEIASDRGDVRSLRDGEEIVVEPDPRQRVRYLGIAGGVEAPVHLGSRATLAVAGIGRSLRPGDRVAPANAQTVARTRVTFEPRDVVRVVPGPDHPDLALALAASAWRIGASSDRTGTRLEGAPLASTAGRAPSSPMVSGAIQLPPGGAPIVIGPDGPTTGGYPIVAVVLRADRAAFHALPIGAAVRFECATL